MDLLAGLRTFTRIVEVGSFSAVARETGSSHSAVTRLVGQLEDHFGVRLFQRTTRRLSLTEDGQDLLGYARNVLDMAAEMEGALGRQRSSPTGLVRVGTPAGATPFLVPRLGELLKRYPGLVVDLAVSDQFGNLIEERLDIAIIGQEPADSSLIARVVGSVGRIAVASPAYLERHGAPGRPEDLAQHPCIIHDVGPGSSRWRFGPKDKPIEVDVSGPLHANSATAVQRGALAGLGIARMSELQVADDLRANRLYRLLPDYLPEQFQISIVYPSRRHVPPRVRVTIDFLIEQTRQLFAQFEHDRVWGENESTWLT